MATIIGKAPGTTVRLGNGGTSLVYAGQPVPGGADEDDVKRLIEEGYLEEAVTAAEEPAGDGPPPGNASTDTWRQYAVGLGIGVPEDATRDDVKALVASHSQ